MSADNWGACPRCRKIEIEKSSQLKLQVEKQYGKVSSEKYLELLKKAEEPTIVRAGVETLREDYEMGITSDGRFFVNYGCSCDKCGFSHKFKHEIDLTL